ncbi:hypothetical protein I79_022735 [Cricetulus griseus]|uniref:Uncharacterized protein n=1 Tax=Cricetulus griseus TaxID=10029 RepID=G3IG56_CRIGR|nr:hypothetical protein I79_022735 [Cricetulus griseus]
MEEEQQPESSVSPQKKAKLAEIKRKKRVRSLLPHQRDRKSKLSSSQGADQETFKCECHCCLKYAGNTSGMSAGARIETTSHSPSLEKLTLDLSNLTLNPCAPQPNLMQETTQKLENDNMHSEQNGKRMLKRLLH